MKKNTNFNFFKSTAMNLVLIITILTMSACGSNPSASTIPKPIASPGNVTNVENTTPTGKSKVTIGLAYDPQNIGPFQGMSGGRIGVLYTLYEFLVTTVGGEMEGVLMKNYEKIDDLTYNCEIYDYISDQAGNHLTAADVAYSYNMGMSSGNLPKLGSIESVKVISDYVVQFKFANLAIGDLGALWMECPIVTQAAYEASPDKMATDPVSTTAYKCTEFISGAKMIFTNTQKYWQTDKTLIKDTSKSNVDVIEFDIISDSAQLTNALKTKAIDVTNWLSNSDISDFENVPDFATSLIPDNVTYLMLFNCDATGGKFANNLALRQACAYAINRSQLVAGALNGNGNTVKTWGNKNYSDYGSTWDTEDYYDYNITKATELAKEAGAEGLTLNLMVVSGDTEAKMATIVQAQLAKIGITVNISTYDAQLINDYKYKANQWDIFIEQAGSTSYLANVWKLGLDNRDFTHGGAENFVIDNKLQTLLESALDIDDHSEATMDAFHQYLKEQCYGIGLLQKNNTIAHSNKITEIVVDARRQVIPGACAYGL